MLYAFMTSSFALSSAKARPNEYEAIPNCKESELVAIPDMPLYELMLLPIIGESIPDVTGP
jgi:hypothetical protein